MVRSLDLITFKNLALPMYSYFLSMISVVDEEDQWKAYNWGYDPVQYNVPEGSYAVTPTILMHDLGTPRCY